LEDAADKSESGCLGPADADGMMTPDGRGLEEVLVDGLGDPPSMHPVFPSPL